MSDDLNMVNQLSGQPLPAEGRPAETGAPLAGPPEMPSAASEQAAADPSLAATPPTETPPAEPSAAPSAAQPSAAAEPAATEQPPAAPTETDKKKIEAAEENIEVEKEPEKQEELKSDKMEWYILKVQSNREDSIREGLLRRVAIAGLDRYFGEVIVPTEKVTEFKGGKKRVTKRKLYPGYLVVHMEINDDTWFLVRETPGIGDFTGASGRPSVMLPHEVARIVAKSEEKSEKAPKLKIAFHEGDRVKINEGTFENFEGEVDSIDETNGRVTVMINIFGRSTPVELEYWQIEAL